MAPPNGVWASFFDHLKHGAVALMDRFKDFFGAGVVSPSTDFGLSFPVTPNMTCTVAAGTAWTPSGYRVHYEGTPTYTLSFATADPTYGRIDLIEVGPVPVADINIPDGLNQNLGLIQVKTGTPSASPVRPAPDTENVALFSVSIAANQTSVTAANITDLRTLVTCNLISSVTPMTGVGDMIYGGTAGAEVRLPANTSATKQFLTETGTGSAGQEPVWGSITAADVPTVDSLRDCTATFNLNGQLASNAHDPVSNQDLTTKTWVLAQILGASSQYQGVKIISSTATMDTTYLRQLTALTGSSNYSVVLPSSTSCGAGGTIVFWSGSSATVTVSAAGADQVKIAASNSVTSFTMQSGDTMSLVSDGTGNWYASGGSVQLEMASIIYTAGDIKPFAGGSSSVPNGWLICDGSAVSRTTYATLFGVIGTTYGTGDGSTTFNLPDIRGRTIVGAGAGTGLTSRTLGATGGEENHALITAELAAHNHTVSITDPGHNHPITDPAHSHALNDSIGPSGSSGNVAGGTGYDAQAGATVGNTTGITVNNATTGVTASTANTGSGSGHNTMQPFIALNYIIKF